MKKIKEKDILKPGAVLTVKMLPPNFWEKHRAEEKAKEEKERKDEQERVKNLSCPVCKSTNKNDVRKTGDNGIIGPGSRYWVTEEYYYCMDCGVMFKDINKPKGTSNGPTIRA